jgi:hypothetical protein
LPAASLTVIATLTQGAAYDVATAAASVLLAPPSANFTITGATVTFDSNTILKDDGSGAYPTMNQWVDQDGKDNLADPNTTTVPIFYNVGDYITTTVDFKLGGQQPGGTYTITGVASGIQTEDMTFSWTGTVGAGQTELKEKIMSSCPLDELIDYGKLDIDWTVTRQGSTPVHYGSTSNTIYVAGGGLNNQFETVLLVGCTGALGQDADGPDQLIVDEIWNNKFSKSAGLNIVEAQLIDGKPVKLTYWANKVCAAVTTAELLKTHDGQCGAWARFFVDVLAAQGVASRLSEIVPIEPSSLKNILPAHWQYVSAAMEVNQIAQGGARVDKSFTDHMVVKYGDHTIYDPSYGNAYGLQPGATMQTSEQAWEDASVTDFDYRVQGPNQQGLFTRGSVLLSDIEKPRLKKLHVAFDAPNSRAISETPMKLKQIAFPFLFPVIAAVSLATTGDAKVEFEKKVEDGYSFKVVSTEVGPTKKVMVLCEKLPCAPTPQQLAEAVEADPGRAPQGPERYQYSFLLDDGGGREKARTLWVDTVWDWPAVFNHAADFSILAVSLETHALVVVFHQDGATWGDVIALDGTRRGIDMSSGKDLVRESGSSDPTIDSATILGTYEAGDLTVVLHNTQKERGPEFYKFSLQPHWVRVPDAPPATTQPATSRP